MAIRGGLYSTSTAIVNNYSIVSGTNTKGDGGRADYSDEGKGDGFDGCIKGNVAITDCVIANNQTPQPGRNHSRSSG